MNNHDVVRIVNHSVKEGTFIVSWNVTRLCNYACDFCIQGNRNKHIEDARGESERIRTKVCKELVRLIERKGKCYPHILVRLIGGEVTILRDFPAIVGRIVNARYDGDLRINITTNLSFKPEYFEPVLSAYKNYVGPGVRTMHMSTSFYKNYATIEEFSQKLAYIAERSLVDDASPKAKRAREKAGKKLEKFFSFGTGFPVATDADYEEYLAFAETAKSHGVEKCHPIKLNKYPTSFSEDIRAKIVGIAGNGLEVTFKSGEVVWCRSIRELGFMLDDVERFNPQGYLCDAGQHSLYVSNLGQVLRCPSSRGLETLGPLRHRSDYLTAPQACSGTHCGCMNFGTICAADYQAAQV